MGQPKRSETLVRGIEVVFHFEIADPSVYSDNCDRTPPACIGIENRDWNGML
jgi:hypothetical protein